MEWSFSSKISSRPQFLSFSQNWSTHYISVQDQTTISASMNEPEGKRFTNSFINPHSLGGSPIISPPVSVFPASITNTKSSYSTPASSQLTIFYDGSVSLYQDISPDMAQAIMLLAGNGSNGTKPVSITKQQNPVPATIDLLPLPPTYLPSVSYIFSGSSEVTGSGPARAMASLASKHNNKNNVCNMAQSVGLPQARKASLARFMEKRKERVINLSPYYVDKKLPIDYRTPISECVSSSYEK